MTENVFIRPGALLVIAMALGVGLGIYSWSTDLLDQEGVQDTSDAITCSTLDVNLVGESQNETHHVVYIQMNQNVEAFAVTFRGEEDEMTEVVGYGDPMSITEIAAPVTGAVDTEVVVAGCDRTFHG